MQLKIAVIFVAQGQEKESEILANSRGSLDYENFLATLGWEVDLTTHTGYRGGLDKAMKSAAKPHYYCSPTHEVIFHVATKMTNDVSDTIQLKKKRHLGNDEVQIVWNDHYRPFDHKIIQTKVTKAWVSIICTVYSCVCASDPDPSCLLPFPDCHHTSPQHPLLD